MSNFAVKADTSHNAELLEIYTHDIFFYADEFIDNELQGTKDKSVLKSYFEDIIYYIVDRIKKPDINNIELLDDIFCNVFLKLCSKCDIIPTLEAFSWLVSINNSTFSAWQAGDYRKATPIYGETVKKWREICKGKLVNVLTQSKGGDINRIFIAKAAYGMAETAPVQIAPQPMQALNNEQLAARLGGRIESKEDIIDSND